MTWGDHVHEWDCCHKCPLGEKAQNHVLARWSVSHKVEQWSINREWLFFGEAPGPSEDALGTAFAPDAPAGNVLECLLDELEIRDYCISNVIACFPLDWEVYNATGKREFRAPTKDEAQACSPRVHQLIEIVKPKAIVLLGAEAKRYIAKVADSFSIPHCEVMHPSAIGRWDGYTKDWEKRRRENVSYKKARDTIQLFEETLV